MTRHQLICLILVLACAGFPALCAAELTHGDGIESTALGLSLAQEGIDVRTGSMNATGSLSAPLPAWSLCIGGTLNDWGRVRS